MTLSLAQDKLGYGPEQMEALSRQIRLGDLTPVMQLYEDDIKSPLRSAVAGSLLRTLFIQVQKAKVSCPAIWDASPFRSLVKVCMLIIAIFSTQIYVRSGLSFN